MLHVNNLTAETMIKIKYKGLIFFNPDPDSNCIRIMLSENVELFKKKKGKGKTIDSDWGWSVITEAVKAGMDVESFSLTLAGEMIGAYDL